MGDPADTTPRHHDKSIGIRRPLEEMRPPDERLLEAMAVVGVVTPSTAVHWDLVGNRKYAERRLGQLVEFGFAKRIDTGTYVITDAGRDWLAGVGPEGLPSTPATEKRESPAGESEE